MHSIVMLLCSKSGKRGKILTENRTESEIAVLTLKSVQRVVRTGS